MTRVFSTTAAGSGLGSRLSSWSRHPRQLVVVTGADGQLDAERLFARCGTGRARAADVYLAQRGQRVARRRLREIVAAEEPEQERAERARSTVTGSAPAILERGRGIPGVVRAHGSMLAHPEVAGGASGPC